MFMSENREIVSNKKDKAATVNVTRITILTGREQMTHAADKNMNWEALYYGNNDDPDGNTKCVSLFPLF